MRNGDCAASVRLHVEMGCGHAEHEESQLPSIHVGQGEGVSEARGPGPPRQGVTRTSSATGPGLVVHGYSYGRRPDVRITRGQVNCFCAIAKPCIAIGEGLVGDWRDHMWCLLCAYYPHLRVQCCECLFDAINIGFHVRRLYQPLPVLAIIVHQERGICADLGRNQVQGLTDRVLKAEGG